MIIRFIVYYFIQKIKYSNEKTLEEIRVLQEKYRDLTEIYTNGELEELNDKYINIKKT